MAAFAEFLALFALLLGAPALEEGRVTAVYDGDTVLVSFASSTERVRYLGVDTPEAGDCYADEATRRNEELVLGKEVVLEADVSERDRYGRLLRYVSAAGVPVGETLVREGYGRVIAIPPNTSRYGRFKEAEREARAYERGLWAACS